MAKRRITRVTTRSGDGGETSLADGSRIAKTDERLHAIGAVDELNSLLGLLVSRLGAGPSPAAGSGDGTDLPAFGPLTDRLQQELFDLGAHLATVGMTPVPEMSWIEAAIEALNARLPPLTEFVIPGGTEAAALTHVCRTVCRRAERHAWGVEGVAAAARYLNRTSDLLFVIARTLNAGPSEERQWRGLTAEGDPAP